MNAGRTTFFPVLLALAFAPGCKFDIDLGGLGGTDDGSWGEEAVETGDDDPPPPPSEEPDRLTQVAVPGAVWSVAWYTSTEIDAADVGPQGLALTGGRDAALLSVETGLPIWTVLELDDGNESRVRVLDDQVVWARAETGESWEMRGYNEFGVLVSASELGHASDMFELDEAALPYVASNLQLLGVDPSDGAVVWTAAPESPAQVFAVSPRIDGVYALEVVDGDDLEAIPYRLRPFTSDGTELETTEYVVDGSLAQDVVTAGEAGELVVVLENNYLWAGRVRALEPGTGDLLWAVAVPGFSSLEIAADPNGDVLVLVAPNEAPAELLRISPAGEVVETRAATHVPVRHAILAVGDGGEIVVGGRDSTGTLRLNRLE